jgi:type IV pilus assembly protein PilB
MTSSCLAEPAGADFTRVDPNAVALLAERWARRYGVLPIRLERGTLVVATSDPDDLDAERTVGFATGHRVRWVQAPADELARQINRWYPDAAARREPLTPPVEVEHLGFVSDESTSIVADVGTSVIRLVDQLLAEGIQAGASRVQI